MKFAMISTFALARSITVPNMVVAQGQAQDRDQLQDCGSLGAGDCADLLRIRDQLKDCDGVSSDACTTLLREHDRLQACADQVQDKEQARDCAPDSAGSGGSGNN